MTTIDHLNMFISKKINGCPSVIVNCLGHNFDAMNSETMSIFDH